MKHKKIKLKTVDGFSISGVHTVSKKKSVVLWLHGIAETMDEFCNLFKDGAEYLGRYGIDSIRIDFRGHGKSSGKSTDFTITGQLMDIDSAILFLKKFYQSEVIDLHLVGCSFGSPPSLFSAQVHNEIKSITLIAPVLSYFRTFIKPETDWASDLFNEKTVKKLEKTNKLKITNDFAIGMTLYKEMLLIHPERVIGKLAIPVTIIHGDSDSMVPYQVTKDLSMEFSQVKLHSIKDMDHGFNDINDEAGNSEKSFRNKEMIYNIIKTGVI
jgi:pimeloyl-ACP methyl ester carboxylesterase